MIKTQYLNSCLYSELDMDSQVKITGYFNQTDVNSNRLDYPNQFVKARKKTSLSEGKCLICSKIFYYYKSAEKGIFCSYLCKYESQREYHQIKCLTCNNIFVRNKSRNAKYCSKKCFGVSRRVPNSKRAPKECINCGDKCDGRAKYCTDCKGITNSGSKSHFWKGGTFDYNGSNWGRVRREVIRRDKVCQICFTDKYLDVHHIIPRRVFGKKNYEKFNQINNLILLCKKHHRKTELILFEVEKNGLPNMPELWKAETIDKVRAELSVRNVESV